MKKPNVLYQSAAIKVTYYPKEGEVTICDKTAPALSDCCLFFKAHDFLKMSRAAAKKLPTVMGE